MGQPTLCAEHLRFSERLPVDGNYKNFSKNNSFRSILFCNVTFASWMLSTEKRFFTYCISNLLDNNFVHCLTKLSTQVSGGIFFFFRNQMNEDLKWWFHN